MPALVCPACEAPRLAIERSIELGGDGDSDEISLQTVACGACAFRSVALYEESRRGASERFHHFTVALSEEHLGRVTELIRQCPAPRKSSCDCASHRSLGQKNERGNWSLEANGFSAVGAGVDLELAKTGASASAPREREEIAQYRPAWEAYARSRHRLYRNLVLSVLASVLVTSVGRFQPPLWLHTTLFALCGLSFLFSLPGLVRPFACPRCGKPYFGVNKNQNRYAMKCRHCGLARPTDEPSE